MARMLKFVLGLGLVGLASVPKTAQAQSPLGFEVGFGYLGMGGDFGKVLSGGWFAESNLEFRVKAMRYGLGVDVASIDVEEPFERESVSKVGFHLFATYMIPAGQRVKPFIQGRVGAVRLRPEGDVFDPEPEPLPDGGEEEEGENPAPRVDGFEGGVGGGLEFLVTGGLKLGLSGTFSYLTTDEVDLTAIDLGTVGSGTSWRVKAAVRWAP